jgi:hypothetical protein
MGAADQGRRHQRGLSAPSAEPRKHSTISALELPEAFRRGEVCFRGFLHHDQCVAREPAAVACRGERAFREALAIGRVEEGKREWIDRMRRAEPGGIAPKDLADAAEPERRDVLADQPACRRGIVDEQRERRAARECLDAERAGAREEIEHTRAADRIAIGMNENVEQRLAQPVCGRTDRVGLGRCQHPSAQPPTDDAHQRPLPR